ncbi:MAG: biotin--[acetyl-CoA-carboxylase] ligase [Ruminococcaceae bacterium]|nr:biotin--[acetyl-CoA-carboxylase] ligase [Oscillospiraceae bacterium]
MIIINYNYGLIMTSENLITYLEGYDVEVIAKHETVSTNTDARELIKNTIPHPALIVADQQSGGRGRQGKSFLSPVGGLYMTLALPANIPIEQAIGATSCAAVAVCRGIEAVCDAKCGIKWINDIYLGGKKLCGILTESVNDYETMTSRYLIIGVGVNIDVTPTVTDSAVEAVSLNDCGCDVSKDILCAGITKELLLAYESGFDFSLYAEEYTRRSILLGQEIIFTSKGIVKHGTAKSITDRGALVVQSEGKEIILDSGEVSVRLN